MNWKKQNNNNNNENKKQYHFQVKNISKGFFDLFNKVSNTYIYKKNFVLIYQNIIPPKSIHYSLSLENLYKTDLLTMNFDKKIWRNFNRPKIKYFNSWRFYK